MLYDGKVFEKNPEKPPENGIDRYFARFYLNIRYLYHQQYTKTVPIGYMLYQCYLE